MKKLALILLIVIISIWGCTSIKPFESRPPQEVLIKIQSDGPTKIDIGETVQKQMFIKNPEGELSNLSFIHDRVGYIKLWGGLTGLDAILIWNDLILLEKVYKVEFLTIYISSGGGESFSGLALSDEIERISKRIPVTMYASGIVASAAVPIFASGTKRVASRGAIFMVHGIKSYKFFEAEGEKDIASQGVMFRLLKSRYLEKMASHSRLSADEWLKKIEEITWFDAEQAKEWGLVYKIE